MLAIRSLLFNLIMLVTVTLYASLAMLTFPLPPLARYRVIRQWGRFMIWLLRRLCSLDYRVEGREHLPKGPAIIISKHQSTWETLAYQQIFPPQVWVLKRELLWVPFFGWGLAMTQPIAIARGSGRRAIEQIVQQGRQRLDTGRWVVVFPEGTRVAPGQQRRYGLGGAVLASETGYPVVPVAHNAGSYWPRRGFVKKPGTIRVVIGPAIETHGKTPEQINAQAQEWIEDQMQRLEGRD